MSAPELFCPRCIQPLKRAKRYKGQAGTCGKCHGVWMAWTCFEPKLAAGMKEHPSETPDILSSGDYAPLFCLECAAPMTRRIYEGRLAVETEECGRHGVWLDRGELDELNRLLRRGRRKRSRSAMPGPNSAAPHRPRKPERPERKRVDYETWRQRRRPRSPEEPREPEIERPSKRFKRYKRRLGTRDPNAVDVFEVVGLGLALLVDVIDDL